MLLHKYAQNILRPQIANNRFQEILVGYLEFIDVQYILEMVILLYYHSSIIGLLKLEICYFLVDFLYGSERLQQAQNGSVLRQVAAIRLRKVTEPGIVLGVVSLRQQIQSFERLAGVAFIGTVPKHAYTIDIVYVIYHVRPNLRILILYAKLLLDKLFVLRVLVVRVYLEKVFIDLHFAQIQQLPRRE